MHCPLCEYKLQKLTVTTTAGGKFDVDHCGRCGGTWFDPYEINRIPYHEVLRIANLTVKPKKPSYIEKTLYCPRCHTELETFTGESMPAGVSFLRCPADRGVWATQRQLEEFKKHQEEVIDGYKKGDRAFPSLSVVFVPTLMILFLLLSTFATITKLSETREGRTQAAAQITNLSVTPISPTSVVISFNTKIPLKSSISYGISTLDLATEPIAIIPSTIHSINLQDLKPETTYIYTITLEDQRGKTITSEINSFVTGK